MYFVPMICTLVSPCGGGSTPAEEVEDAFVRTVVLADSFAGVAPGVLEAASAIDVDDVEA
jgi:hypothetical protein